MNNNDWTPTTKSKPSVCGEYIATLANGKVEKVDYNAITGLFTRDGVFKSVVAWMPVPKAYKA